MVRACAARVAVLALVLLCAACDFDPPRNEEMAERSAISAEVARLLTNERFDELDALAESYRSTKARMPSGLWRLSAFYRSLNEIYPRAGHSEEMWRLLADPVYKWIEHNPHSPTARLAYARILLNQAWGIRGTGYANTVDESHWRPFFAKVEEARWYLEDHKAVAASDPYWFTEMLEIATIQQWPEPQFSDLAREAFDREPLYYDSYFEAANRSLPKWGGSAERIEALAREAVRRTRDSEGSALYARIYWAAWGSAMLEKSNVDWDEMKRGMDDVLAKYPDDWNFNHFAKFACVAGDYAKASELIGRIKGKPLPFLWGPYWSLERCQLWAMITT